MGESKFDYGQEDYQRAEWLSDQFQREWRYDHTAERWHHWDGSRWAPDEVGAIRYRVAEVSAKVLKSRDITEGQRKIILKLLSMAPQAKALEALATFPEYGTNGDDWDAIPHLLGVKGGIVDLRVNALVEKPGPELLVTKTTGVKFNPLVIADGEPFFTAAGQRAPAFMAFIGQITSEDPAMVAFLLLWFGASLFGFTPEQRFLLMTGIGRNGKGVLKHSIIKAVGEYGAQSDANLYMRSRFGAARSDQARADLLAIKGKRITFFSEPEGNRFNEEMLKAHTGGDRITARALHSNNVQSWDPTHSITFLVNNAPEVEDLGPSMAARVMVADFRERYDGEKEDKLLYRTLEGEAEGILAILCWAAAAWHASWESGAGGITLPARVVEQSKAFMERNDIVANWLNERGEYGEGLSTPSQAAYESYVAWHKGNGEPGDPWSMVRLALELQKKGMKKTKGSKFNSWAGFRLLGAMALAEKGIGDDGE